MNKTKKRKHRTKIKIRRNLKHLKEKNYHINQIAEKTGKSSSKAEKKNERQ